MNPRVEKAAMVLQLNREAEDTELWVGMYDLWADYRALLADYERPPRAESLDDAVALVHRAMDCIEVIPDGLWPAWDDEITEAFNILDDVVGLPEGLLAEASEVNAVERETTSSTAHKVEA